MNPSRVPDLQNLTKQVGDLTEAFSAAALTGDFWDKLRGLLGSLGLDQGCDPRIQQYVQSADSKVFHRMLSRVLAAELEDWQKLDSIRVLSVGCGRLREAFAVHAALGQVRYSELSKKINLWGLELDQELAADTAKIFSEVPGVKICCGDGSKLAELQELPEKFELIYFRHQNFADHLGNWAEMFAAALTRLAPNGRLIITSFSKHEHQLANACLEGLGAISEVNLKNREARLVRKASRKDGRPQMRVDGYLSVFRSV